LLFCAEARRATTSRRVAVGKADPFLSESVAVGSIEVNLHRTHERLA
jgi:hypothetical protein